MESATLHRAIRSELRLHSVGKLHCASVMGGKVRIILARDGENAILGQKVQKWCCKLNVPRGAVHDNQTREMLLRTIAPHAHISAALSSTPLVAQECRHRIPHAHERVVETDRCVAIVAS